jgi:hypothetical protein
MAIVVTGIICALISFVIAAVVVGREAHRLDSFSPVPVYDVERAVEYVAAHLPDELSASLSFWDVRQILDWSREDVGALGLSSESLRVLGPKQQLIEAPIVIDDDRIDRLVGRAVDEGTAFTGPDVRAVLTAELGYLELIGAIGPAADPVDPLETTVDPLETTVDPLET